MIRKDGFCVMHGIVPGQKYNNEYNKPAVNITGEAYELLKKTCPYLAKKGPENTKGCCSLGQLKNLNTQLQTAANLFSRCPSCSKNFYNLWCDFTCSPDQSKFLSYRGGFFAQSDFYVTKQFVDGLYNSCRDVVFPGSNGKVMDFMCGTTAAKCNPVKFTNFIGTKPNAPFTIKFHIDQTVANVTNNNLKMIGCNETYVLPSGRNSSKCSCQDCETNCPVPPTPPAQKKPIYVLGIKLFYFVVGACVLVWLALFLVYSVLDILRTSKNAIDNQSKEANVRASSMDSYVNMHKSTDVLYGGNGRKDKGIIVRIGVQTENILQSLFRRWGTWCAKNPLLVMCCSLVVVVICSAGLAKFTVITSPIDLWSSKDSRARQNKDYFDEKFSPFYRTEQVIITSNHELPVEEYEIYQQNIKNFSGVIYKDILNEVSFTYCIYIVPY